MDNNRDIPDGLQAGYSAQLFDPKIYADNNILEREKFYLDSATCITANREGDKSDNRMLKSHCFSQSSNCLILLNFERNKN